MCFMKGVKHTAFTIKGAFHEDAAKLCGAKAGPQSPWVMKGS